jgi:hypothetical protein
MGVFGMNAGDATGRVSAASATGCSLFESGVLRIRHLRVGMYETLMAPSMVAVHPVNVMTAATQIPQ